MVALVPPIGTKNPILGVLAHGLNLARDPNKISPKINLA